MVDKVVKGELDADKDAEITIALENFSKMRNELSEKNINKMSVDNVMSFLDSSDDASEAGETGPISDFPPISEMTRRRFSAWYIKTYDDGEWQAFVPLTYEAARKLGGSTDWCTSSSDTTMFDLYTTRYGAFVIYYRNGEPIAQYQREPGDIRDVNDDGLDAETEEEMPENIDETLSDAEDYFSWARREYIEQRFKLLQSQELTTNAIIENFEVWDPVDGLACYRNYGLYGIARVQSPTDEKSINRPVELLTKPIYGPQIYNRCGIIGMAELPDFEVDEINEFEYAFFYDKDIKCIARGAEEFIEYMNNKISSGELKIEDLFDAFIEKQRVTWLFDDKNELCFMWDRDGRKITSVEYYSRRERTKASYF